MPPVIGGPASGVPSPVGMRGGLGKTLLTAFLLLAIVPLGLLAFATYNQIQTDTRRKVLDSLGTIVTLEEAHIVDWAQGCRRELGLLAGVCVGDDVVGDPAPSGACTTQAAVWLTETQAAQVVLVQAALVASDEGPATGGATEVATTTEGSGPPKAGGTGGTGGEAVRVIAENGEMLGQGLLARMQSAALWDGIAAGRLVMVPAANGEAGGYGDVAIGYRLPAGERYLVALFPWQSLQRGAPGGPVPPASGGQSEVTIRVSLAIRDEDSGFWVLDFGSGREAPSRQRLGEGVGEKAGGVEQALGGQSGAGMYTNLAGVPVLGAYRWNPQLQVAVVAEQPQTEAQAAGNTLTAVIVAITLGMALVTAAIAAVVTRRVTRPIVQLTETAARMARGDLDQQVTCTRQDEIGVLALAFNRMAAELRVLYGDLNAKVEFLTNMSHALRTPLTSIIGFSRLMLKELDGPLTDLQRTDLATIHEGGQQLLELINDMLELSELELETEPITVDEVDLAGMIDGVMATARALALNKPVELIAWVADDLPTLYTDGRRVRRVLLALMSNAISTTAEGTIRLSATAGDGHVTIDVRAAGAAGAAALGAGQADIFRQGESFRAEGGTGTEAEFHAVPSGLGLTISRQMVEKLGGRIRAERWERPQVLRKGLTEGGGDQPLALAEEQSVPTSERSGSAFVFTLPISPSDMT